jgi:PAS domain S-box-containing protein
VEADLSNSKAGFQAIFDHAALGIAQIGLDKSWLRVNNQFCQMLGYSEAELRTKTLGDISHPDYTEESRAGRQQLLAGEISSHTMEKRYIRKDGTVFWGRLNRSLVRDCDGQPQYLVAVLEDITDRKDADRALRESEQRLTLGQKAAHLGLCQWDLSTNAYTFSEEYARLYGLTADHPPLTLEELPKRTHPDDRERVQAILGDALKRAHAWDIEYRVLWPDGSVHWLHSKGAVMPDALGRPVRSTGVILDITEGKPAETALRQRTLQYQDLFKHMNEGIIRWLSHGHAV